MLTFKDVLVVGAGPTGLTAALALRLRGADVRIVDAGDQGANTSRAAVVHPRTLEVLEPTGVSARLVADAVRVPHFRIGDGHRQLASIDFSDLPTAYPYTAMIAQRDTERILRDRLAELGVAVEWGSEVVALEQDGDGVTVDVRGAGGMERVRAAAVVGADGSHSTVRDLVGIGFPGHGYDHSFLLADVVLGPAVPRDVVGLTFSPAGLVVTAPLPGDRFRVVATAEHVGKRPSLADVQALLDDRIGGTIASDLAWSGRFRVAHRLATAYRSGRVMLAGDAVHVHSPAGGQGMNTGIQDAVDLAETLAGTGNADLDGSDLDGYERRRRPVAQDVIALTDRMTRAATLRRRPARLVRNAVLRAAGSSPAVRHRVALRISELAYR